MFAIPSLSDLAQRARQAFTAYLPGVDAWIVRNNIAPTSKVLAGTLYELYERLNWVFRQAFVLYATGQWLDRHGEQYGMRRLSAAPASGIVVVTTGDAVDIPAGTLFTLGNSSTVYQSTADASLSAAGSVNVSVIALTAGTAGNGLANSPLTISDGTGAGLTGNGASSAVAAIGPQDIENGDDDETDDAYRARILFRMRNPPHGGNAADYVMWASAVPGVTRVFVERIWRGAGTVRVFPIFDNLFAAQGGVATQPYIDTVVAALAPVQPAVAIVTIVAPAQQLIDVTVQGLTPNTTATQNAVIAELQDTFLRKGRVSGSDKVIAPMPYLASPFTFLGNWIQTAVGNAAGVTGADVVGAVDTPIAAGATPALGNVEFISAA